MITRTNRYTEQQLIGKGAYGEVFVATDSFLQRQVAIKRYYRSTGDLLHVRTAIEQWAKLNHPNIAQVLDYSDQEGQLSLVMTYCANASLDQGVKALKSNQEHIAKLFLQLSSAVGHMHGQGLIHRDLKLANILLDSTNSPVLIDLDLCVRYDSPEAVKIAGTPHYMAPELLDGSAPSSRSTDQYALGVMLFEMLSGIVVSQQPETNTGRKNLDRSYELNSAIPRHRDWNAIIAKATNSNPQARYSMISDLTDDVERLINGKQTTARRISRFERTSRWIRKNPFTGALLSVIAASLVFGLLISSFFWSRTDLARKSIVSNTDLLQERIQEGKRQKEKLATLLKTVQHEYSLAENAEKEQQLATVAAQASEAEWQAEAERAKKLTAELESLLVKAKASTDSLTAASKGRDIAIKRLTTEQQKIADSDYVLNANAAWACVLIGDWEEASRRIKLLPADSKEIEYKILFNSIRNKLTSPVRIEIGVTSKRFASDFIDVQDPRYRNTHHRLVGCDDRIIQFSSDRYRGRCLVKLSFSIKGSLSFVPLLNKDEVVIGLLNDGSLLLSEGSKHSVWTFSPESYNPWKAKTPRSRMSPEMESKIDLSFIPLSKNENSNGSNQPSKVKSNPDAKQPSNVASTGGSEQLLSTKNEPAPPGLDPSEAKAWEFCGSIAAQVKLSFDNRNIVSIQSSERNMFDANSFSAIGSLRHLNTAVFNNSGITDQCLVSLAKCTELQLLSLTNAPHISDEGVRELKSFSSLTILSIGKTKATLEGIDDSLLGNLEYLILAGTRLGPSRLSKLSASKRMQEMDIRSMDLEDQDLVVLKELRSLKTLKIADQKVSLEVIDESLLGNLERLVLAGIRLGPRRLLKLSACKKLREFDISSMDMGDEDLGVFKELSSLKTLTIGGGRVSVEALDDTLLKNLDSLTLDKVSLGPTRFSKLSVCKNLNRLAILTMDLRDQDMEVFNNTPALKYLTVSNVAITDRGLEVIERMGNLKQIRLEGTTVSKEYCEERRKKLPNCQVLVLPNAANLLPKVDLAKAWNFNAMETAVGRMTQNSGEMVLEMDKLGSAHWHLQVYSRGIALTEGAKYRVVLTARSTTKSTVELEAGQAAGKYSSVGLRERIALTPEFKRYEFSFTVKGQGQEKTRVGLLLGLGLGKVEVRTFELFPL